MACPLRSTDITPLPRYYQAVRPSAPHAYSRPRGSIHLWLLRCIDAKALMFHTAAASRFRPPVPDAAPSVSRYRRSLSHDLLTNYRGFDIVLALFDKAVVHFRSAPSKSPDPNLSSGPLP